MPPQMPLNRKPTRPYRTVAALALALLILVVGVVFAQFRSGFSTKTPLTLVSDRAGLLIGRGSKVTLNGVEVGKVGGVSEINRDGKPAAEFKLEVLPEFMPLIPANVDASIRSTTLFGGKYVALRSPARPGAPIRTGEVIDARSVGVEINTVFQTVTSIAQSIDPVKLNLTLSGAAEALAGLGGKFGRALEDSNKVLDNLNPKMEQLHSDIKALARVADVVADASPDLWQFLTNVSTTAATLNEQQQSLDATLLSAIGFSNVAADVLDRSKTPLYNTLATLTSTTGLLDTYSPELFCSIRNAADVAPAVGTAGGLGNGYSLRAHTLLLGGVNPYVYPDNLPRVNARGGPGGAPGCWQKITKDLWPAPALVTDIGASIAPYNHLELGSPWATEYVWGRQIGENTINP